MLSIQIDPVQAIRFCGRQKSGQVDVVNMNRFFGVVLIACPGHTEPDALDTANAPQRLNGCRERQQLRLLRVSAAEGKAAVAGAFPEPAAAVRLLNRHRDIVQGSRAEIKV